MKNEFLRAAGVALFAQSLAGCTAPAPYVDAHLGQATLDMRNAQVMHPAAGQNTAAPVGMEASTAKVSYEQYQKSFKAPAQRDNNFVIGVGR